MSNPSNLVNWFEISVLDLERAKHFYERVFGVTLESPIDVGDSRLSFFPNHRETHGIGGALIKCPRTTPSVHGTTVYFHVESIDPVLQRINEAGGKTCMPRQSIGKYGFMAHFLDSEGNRVALHELPKS